MLHMHNIIYIFLLTFLCGAFGRMGGAGGKYRSWMRDWICPLITLSAVWLIAGINPHYWWAYLIVYALMGASLTTYLDSIFGEDNLWVSGFLAGLAFLPLAWTGILWWLIIWRAIMLCGIWGGLNKYLPSNGILIWRRDIIEEFLRYSFLVLTIPLLKF